MFKSFNSSSLYSYLIQNRGVYTSLFGLLRFFDLQFLLRLRLVKTESHKKTPRKNPGGKNDHEEEYVRADDKLK